MNKKGSVENILLYIAIGIVVLIAILMIGGFAIYNIMYVFHSGEETIIIKDKWVKQNGDSGKYLVSSTNGQVFEITDSIVHKRFDSSNLYARLEAGQRCKIKTQGWRFGYLSDYKNIINAECKK